MAAGLTVDGQDVSDLLKRTGDTMTGNLNMGAGLTVDGKDISVDIATMIATGIAAAQSPSGKLVLTATQLNVTKFSETLVVLDQIPAEFTDEIEDIANHQIIIPETGYYAIVGQVTFENLLAENANYTALIKVNATSVCRASEQANNVNNASCLLVMPSQYCVLNDVIKLYAISGASDNTIDIRCDADMTFLAVQRVR